MSEHELPSSARLLLEAGTLCYLAVDTARGPHLTPVVFALDGGCVWVTTSRRSVKSHAFRRDPRVAGLVRVAGAAVTFRGRVRAYDALDPLSWAPAVLGAPALVSAGARFTVKNARFFAGYAVDARRVPFAWTPPGRVFVAIDLEAGRVLDVRSGRELAAWGAWDGRPAFRSGFEPLPRARAIERRVPEDVREAIGNAGDGTLALRAAGRDAGLAVLPVAWTRHPATGSFEARLPEVTLRLAGARGTAPAALEVDRASWWRASRMKGLMVQGMAEVFSPRTARRGRDALGRRVEEGEALVRLVPDRAVWWDGWASGTVRR